jgi:vacuolar protein sorting-associated protein 54
MQSHGKEIENKLLTLVGGLLAAQLVTWDAKPPVPSTSFRNISKHLRKLHEAISDVLSPLQVQNLYRSVHKAFKQRLKEQLIKINVHNNGGPQHG